MTITERIAQMNAAGMIPVKLNDEPATSIQMERGMVAIRSASDGARFTPRVAELVLDEKGGNFKTRETRRFACV